MMRRLTSFDIKVIGIILMVMDHLYEMFAFAGVPIWFHMIGRACAPLFIFMCAEGYHYTHSKIKYARNLWIGYIVMSLIDKYLQQWVPNSHGIILMNNIFGTLLMCVVFMFIYDCLRSRNGKKIAWGIGALALVIGLTAFFIQIIQLQSGGALFNIVFTIFPSLITVEGGFGFVVMGLLFYIFRDKPWGMIVSLGLIALLSTGFRLEGLFTSNFQWMMIFAAIPLAMYNGKVGIKAKWLFYAFYPLHIVIFYLIAAMM